MSVSIQPTYATVWQVMQREYPARIRLSTSRKDQNGNYVNSNWFASLFGDAFKKVNLLPDERTRIRILKGMVEHISVKQKDDTYKEYVNMTIFDFEVEDNQGSPQVPPAYQYQPPQSNSRASQPQEEAPIDDYPF